MTRDVGPLSTNQRRRSLIGRADLQRVQQVITWRISRVKYHPSLQSLSGDGQENCVAPAYQRVLYIVHRNKAFSFFRFPGDQKPGRRRRSYFHSQHDKGTVAQRETRQEQGGFRPHSPEDDFPLPLEDGDLFKGREFGHRWSCCR